LIEIKELLLHHTAGPADQSPESIHKFHQAKNWGTPEKPARATRLVYHYGVDPAGLQWKFNRAIDVTWHCPGHNRIGLSVVLFGDFTKYEVPFDQWQSAVALAARLCKAYNIPTEKVLGHRECFATACPGTYIDPTGFRWDVVSARHA
jgi:N-acetyl-anhydromuramyl-L-alanine amidase AmpD